MTCRADQTTHPRNQAGVLNLSTRIKQFWCNRAHVGIFERLDEILNPIALSALHIVIEENKARTCCGLRAEVAFLRKIEGLIVTNTTEPSVFRRSTLQQ